MAVLAANSLAAAATSRPNTDDAKGRALEADGDVGTLEHDSEETEKMRRVSAVRLVQNTC